ncbi:cell division protein [Pseudalkalibacillus sp. SCS-8]|uniref:cell division suppressor protein YneA n=1 Tax=Pseudalkalibacillus nanhaiensis TaxID=3115291 RepID=UPI0032DBBB8B
MEKRRQGGWSFVIVLVVIIAIMGSYSYVKANSEENIDYMNVKIEEGDTLWALYSKYKEHHTYTNEGFVQWVERNNDVRAEALKPGDTVLIPVKMDMKQVASK